MSDEEAARESGPFCRHWYQLGDCDLLCGNCGHRCAEHSAEDGSTECLDYASDCTCGAWVEPDQQSAT